MFPEYFFKVTQNENHWLSEWACKKPIRAAILLKIGQRVRVSAENNKLGLRPGEFVLSPNEFKKFGLKRTQKKQIKTVLDYLITIKICTKTDRVTDRDGAIIYCLCDNDFMDCSMTKRTGERTKTDRERTRTEKEERKKEYNIYDFYEKFLEEFPLLKNDRVKTAYSDYLQLRKEKKVVLTETWFKANVKKLIKLSNNQPLQAEKILVQTVENGWTGIFEIKDDKQTTTPTAAVPLLEEMEIRVNRRGTGVTDESRQDYKDYLFLVLQRETMGEERFKKTIIPQIIQLKKSLKAKGVTLCKIDDKLD